MHQNSKSRSQKKSMKKKKPMRYAKGGLVTNYYQTTGFGAATKRNKGKTHTLARGM